MSKAHLIQNAEQCVLMVIDVQREYCDPTYKGTHKQPRGTALTEQTARDIALAVPKFRNLGVDIAWIYSHEYSFWPRSPLKSYGGFHHAQPDHKHDRFFAKYEDSAFQPTGLISHFLWANGYPAPKTQFHRFLQRQKKRTLLTCGFNLSACVRRSARDGLRNGFNIVALQDLCANDNENPLTKNGWFDFSEKMARYKAAHRPDKEKRPCGDYEIQESVIALQTLQTLRR